MGTLYDQSGKPVQVDDAHVTQALVSGQYLTDKPAVDVKAGGKVFSVPTENLGKFVAAQPDARVMSDAESIAHAHERQQQELQQKYGGLGDQAKVATVSALGGATLGLSDLALGAFMSREQKETLEKQKEANPYTNIAGGVVGAIAPTLLTGGAAAPEEAALLGGEALGTGSKVARALGKVVTAPTRSLEGLSNLVERGATRLVGEGADSFLGQVAQKAITKAAGGMASGAIATGAMDVGEDALSPDHNLTGEQLLHHMGIGALLGGGLGLAGGAGGAVLDRIVGGEEGALGKALEHKANELEFSSTGAKTKEIRKLSASGIEPHEAGAWMDENLSKFTEDGSHPMTRQGKMQALDAAMEDAQPKISAHIDALDKAGAVPDAAKVIDRLRSELIEPLDKKLGMESVTNRLTKIVDKAEDRLQQNPTFREMFDLRRELDDLAYRDRKVLDQSNAMKELRNARAMLEDEIGSQGKAALGPEWSSGYNEAKNQYRMAASINDAAQSADKRIAGNHGISLTDTIAASHGLGAVALGHPLGIVTALAAGVANHLIKTYGDAVGSQLLRKLTSTGALQTTVMQAAATKSIVAAQRNYTSSIARGLAALTRGEVASNGPGRPKSLDGDYADKSKLVKSMINDPQQHDLQIQKNATAFGPSFATVGSAYQRSALTTSVVLANALPKPKPIDPLMPKAGVVEPTDQEKAKFTQVFNAVKDPVGLLHDAAKGQLTRAQIDAVAQTHPAILADMQKHLTQELKTIKEPLAPAQLASVKMLLGQPVFDHTINPTPLMPQPKVTTAGAGVSKGLSKPLKLDTGNISLAGSRASRS